MATFTVKYLESLRPAEREYARTEGGRTGLHVRVYPGGRRVLFYYFISPVTGRRRKWRLSDWPQTTLAKARERLKVLRDLVDDGKDPFEEKQKKRERRKHTLTDLAEQFMMEHSRPKKKSWREDERLLNAYILPRWRNRSMVDITPADVRTLIKRVARENGPVQSNRVLAAVSRLFNFAMAEHLLKDNPAATVRRIHKEQSRDRVLNESEIMALWSGLDEFPASEGVKGALRVILLTACRPGEVVAARWEHVDGDWLTLPDTKSGRSHRIFLTDLAKEAMGQRQEAGFVFHREGRAIPTNDLSKLVRRGAAAEVWPAHWTPHDLRRTAGTKMSELGARREVLTRILGHVDPSVTSIYDRHSYDPEAARAWQKWSRRLKRILTGQTTEKVLDFPGGA